ncbi:hypothetical protein E2C01_017316 [Portunus trituberculatus]|uniref:Uncharacterized protein n=1 Tax=Portunus trituberculatus TaxID=210409 RepID=A0A5B7DT51_PORTR|nr:hypothetical protein [Portunus trituberculatus]
MNNKAKKLFVFLSLIQQRALRGIGIHTHCMAVPLNDDKIILNGLAYTAPRRPRGCMVLCCTEPHLYDAKMLIRMYRREVYGPAAAAAAAGPAAQHRCMHSYLTDSRSESSSPASSLKEVPVGGGGDSPCRGWRCPRLHDRHKIRK